MWACARGGIREKGVGGEEWRHWKKQLHDDAGRPFFFTSKREPKARAHRNKQDSMFLDGAAADCRRVSRPHNLRTHPTQKQGKEEERSRENERRAHIHTTRLDDSTYSRLSSFRVKPRKRKKEPINERGFDALLLGLSLPICSYGCGPGGPPRG